MAQRAAIAFSMPFAVRGLALAEQRLAYLTELYDSGRWRRFHDEADFLFNIREAKAAVDSWQKSQMDRAFRERYFASTINATPEIGKALSNYDQWWKKITTSFDPNGVSPEGGSLV